MEGFWEWICDWGMILLKSFAVLLAVRVFLLITESTVTFPYFDDLMFWLFDFIGTFFPGFGLQNL